MATPCIILQQKGTTRQSNVGSLNGTEIAKVLRRAQVPDKIGEWILDEIHYVVYGYSKGRTGTENKHELPPPYDDKELFGDIVIVCHTKDGDIHPCTTDSWTSFLSEQVIEEEEEEEDDEEDEEEEEEEEKEEEPIVEEVDGEEVVIPEAEEEEEEAPLIRKKPASRSKKINRKLPAFFELKEMEAISYTVKEEGELHPIRLATRGIIESKLSVLPTSDQLDLELGIFNATIEIARLHQCWRRWENPEFKTHYEVIARRTITNLDPSSYVKNTELLKSLLTKSMLPHEIPFLPFTELFPEKWKSMIDHQAKQEQRALEGDKDMASNMFKCRACGKRQCTYYELQTRSADEPMTIFIRCIPCGKQWRQ
jgi:DNA-directed RNA polymerase subunit M/transcription elongation factor TFIIS